jgi:hypothetical protein
MTLLRVLENMCLTPVVEVLDLRYRRPRRKCGEGSLDGGREVVQHGLRAKAAANGRQGYAKAAGPASMATGISGRLSHRVINELDTRDMVSFRQNARIVRRSAPRAARWPTETICTNRMQLKRTI